MFTPGRLFLFATGLLVIFVLPSIRANGEGDNVDQPSPVPEDVSPGLSHSPSLKRQPSSVDQPSPVPEDVSPGLSHSPSLKRQPSSVVNDPTAIVDDAPASPTQGEKKKGKNKNKKKSQQTVNDTPAVVNVIAPPPSSPAVVDVIAPPPSRHATPQRTNSIRRPSSSFRRQPSGNGRTSFSDKAPSQSHGQAAAAAPPRLLSWGVERVGAKKEINNRETEFQDAAVKFLNAAPVDAKTEIMQNPKRKGKEGKVSIASALSKVWEPTDPLDKLDWTYRGCFMAYPNEEGSPWKLATGIYHEGTKDPYGENRFGARECSRQCAKNKYFGIALGLCYCADTLEAHEMVNNAAAGSQCRNKCGTFDRNERHTMVEYCGSLSSQGNKYLTVYEQSVEDSLKKTNRTICEWEPDQICVQYKQSVGDKETPRFLFRKQDEVPLDDGKREFTGKSCKNKCAEKGAIYSGVYNSGRHCFCSAFPMYPASLSENVYIHCGLPGSAGRSGGQIGVSMYRCRPVYKS